MTDNDIIKALEHCMKPTGECEECPLDNLCYGNCFDIVKEEALNLINRQKAEIERLQEEIGSLNKKYPCTVDVGNNCLVYARSLGDYEKFIGDVSAEAVKEFADNAIERVEKAKLKYQRLCKEQGEEMEEHMHIHFNGIIKIINNLLKERVGDE